MAHDPDSEVLTPDPQQLAATESVQSFAPAEEAGSRFRSEWDPRSAPGTYFLLAVNLGVFFWMVLHGVSWTDPSVPALLHYGAGSAQLELYQGQWFRLLTATFVHIGLLHIATNMWCLWNLGLLGEPLLGPWGMIAVYVLTGVAGNLLSLFSALFIFHANNVGAGASGAVFGIAGILIILLSNKRLPIPWSELQRLRTSVIRFAAINLLIGGVTIFAGPIHIDNSAHIGGFVSGLALGPGLVPRMTAGRQGYLARQRFVFIVAAFALALIGYWLSRFV